MSLKIFIVLLFFICNIKCSFAQQLNIAVFYKKNVKKILFSTLSGNYNITGDGILITGTTPSDTYSITAENNIVSIRDNNKSLGYFRKLEFTAATISGTFQINTDSPPVLKREYDDDLTIVSKNGNLLIINKIDLEKYIAGVVESEAGSNAPPEFYKSQAILIRTYALKNMHRHSGSGFSLCDNIHCQSYKGKSKLNNLITNAVEETRGMVLTDKQNNLITTPYHSNCGGLTSSTSDVWQKDLSHLAVIKDPFCTHSKNASWIKKITIRDWENYLRKYGVDITTCKSDDYKFNQSGRKKFYHVKNRKVLLTTIRDDWDLKSTFFSIRVDENNLIFNGRGFGHGVGLCQEGAIEMARVGYTYLDILYFYFRNVRVTCYKDISKY